MSFWLPSATKYTPLPIYLLFATREVYDIALVILAIGQIDNDMLAAVVLERPSGYNETATALSKKLVKLRCRNSRANSRIEFQQLKESHLSARAH